MKHLYQKITISILIGFILSLFLINTVFIASSPRINKLFFGQLKDASLSLVYQSQQLFTKRFLSQPIPTTQPQIVKKDPVHIPQAPSVVSEKLQKIPLSSLQPITKGVYATGDKAENIVYIRITEDVEFEEHVVNVDGKQVKIRFPKGSLK